MESHHANHKDGNNNNHGNSRISIHTIDSYPSPYDSETENADKPKRPFSENFYELIKRMQLLTTDKDIKEPVYMGVAEVIDLKHYSPRVMKTLDISKAIAVPEKYEQIVMTTDPALSIGGGKVVLTPNRSSKIFLTIASYIFHTTDPLMVSQTKLLFLKQIERDYADAKKKKDEKEIRRCVKLVTTTGLEADGPWFDEEWLVASKAFFAPIHVLYNCRRIPVNPHVRRYQFSPVVENEKPIRMVIDNGDY